jgi:hypothetical protein
MHDIIDWLVDTGTEPNHLAAMERYRDRYGV